MKLARKSSENKWKIKGKGRNSNIQYRAEQTKEICFVGKIFNDIKSFFIQNKRLFDACSMIDQ